MVDTPDECPKCGNSFMMQVKINHQAGTRMFQCQDDDCGNCVTKSL